MLTLADAVIAQIEAGVQSPSHSKPGGGVRVTAMLFANRDKIKRAEEGSNLFYPLLLPLSPSPPCCALLTRRRVSRFVILKQSNPNPMRYFPERFLNLWQPMVTKRKYLSVDRNFNITTTFVMSYFNAVPMESSPCLHKTH